MSVLNHQSEVGPALEKQIKALLEKSRRSRKAPKMSLEELAVAIITINPDTTLNEVKSHILTTFKYYNVAAVEAAMMTRIYQGSAVIGAFNVTFNNLRRRFEVPIEVFPANPDVPNDEDELYVNPLEAQIFLRKRLTPSSVRARENNPPFPFLDLPVELRLQIYGHVLGLPKSGVAVRLPNRYTNKKEVVVRSKNFNAELQISDWAEPIARSRRDEYESRRHDGTFICQDLQKHLAVLSVNKEIYNEAMPVFYAINSFVCSDLVHLEEFLATLAPERREELKHISFFYTKNTHSRAAKAFKMLGEIEKLKRLDIVIQEEDFVGLKKGNGDRMFPDMLKLPGFHTLRSMRAVKTVQFHGECDTIREALQSWVVDNEVKAGKPKRPKPKPRVKKVVEVVEIDDDDDDDDDGDQEEEGEELEDQDEEDKVEEVEEEVSVLATAAGESAEKEDEEHRNGTEEALDEIQVLGSFPYLTSDHHDAPPISRPSTPPMRATKELQSPFNFKSSSNGSYPAADFGMENPFAQFNHVTPGQDAVLRQSMPATLLSPQYDEGNEMTQYSEQDIPMPDYTLLVPGWQPVPDIATRQLLHGPGQMGDWRSKPNGVQTQTQTWPLNVGMGPVVSASAGTNMMAPQVDDPFYVPAPFAMEDLLDLHEDYELLQ